MTIEYIILLKKIINNMHKKEGHSQLYYHTTCIDFKAFFAFFILSYSINPNPILNFLPGFFGSFFIFIFEDLMPGVLLNTFLKSSSVVSKLKFFTNKVA